MNKDLEILLQKYNKYIIKDIKIDENTLTHLLEDFIKKNFKPKRKQTGYQLFCLEIRPVLKEENPNFNYKEINKEISNLWSNLSKEDKDEWILKAKGEIKKPLLEELLDIKRVQKILDDVHSDLKIIKDSYQTIIELLNPLFNKSKMMIEKGDYNSIITIIYEVDEILGKYAKSSVDRYDRFKDNILGADWYKIYKVNNVEKNDIIKCSLIFEYLLAEILELSGNYCRDKGRVRLSSNMIENAIKNDLALDKLRKI